MSIYPLTSMTGTVIANDVQVAMLMIEALDRLKETCIVESYGFSQDDPSPGRTTFTIQHTQIADVPTNL